MSDERYKEWEAEHFGVGLEPTVGMGCTIQIGSDRHACTILEVARKGKLIRFQRDKAVLNRDFSGPGDTQRYLYVEDKQGKIYQATKRADGVFRESGSHHFPVTLGRKEAFHDFER